MKADFYYISFEGGKFSTEQSTRQIVHHILLQEKACVQLPDANWIVLSEKEDKVLQDILQKALAGKNAFTAVSCVSSEVLNLLTVFSRECE